MTRLGVGAALVDGRLLRGDVSMAGDTITAVGLPGGSGSLIAAPGFVDLQVNGFAGVDLMTADVEQIHHVSRALAAHGVTAWMPTLISATQDDTDRALDAFAKVVGCAPGGTGTGALPLGVHLEGPYLSAYRLGTHPPAHRRDPDLGQLQAWLRRGPVVAVTLAPELPGALDLVRFLSRQGILVSLGHSDATAAQAHAAFDAGARAVTHLFNAMSPLNHREPGLPGAALARPDVVVQLVVDGHHLADDVIRLVWTAAAGRIVLVTDATAAAGRDDGDFVLAGVRLQVREGAVRNSAGSLAGSALTLDLAVRNACEVGIGLESALVAVTEQPARLLRRTDVGRLQPGARADVVVLDEHLVLRDCYVAGTPVDRNGP